jgi:hypothetical protein
LNSGRSAWAERAEAPGQVLTQLRFNIASCVLVGSDINLQKYKKNTFEQHTATLKSCKKSNQEA